MLTQEGFDSVIFSSSVFYTVMWINTIQRQEIFCRRTPDAEVYTILKKRKEACVKIHKEKIAEEMKVIETKPL